MKTTCKFCQSFCAPAGAATIRPWDEVLFESTNFVVIPTVGSIVPGWLLLVPRKHFLCVGAMGDSLLQEMSELRREATQALCDQFGPVATFEHGPAEPGTSVGCSIDHAHLHLVATKVHLLRGAQQLAAQPLKWESVAGLEATTLYHNHRVPYLYVELSDGEAWIGTHPKIESQLFRKVIAAASGRTDVWDWKCHAFEENVKQTVHALADWKSGVRA